MKKHEVVRLYNFSDGTLVTKGLEKVAFMKRDEAEFITFGITPVEVNALEIQINKFSDTVTDIEARNDQTAVTVEKDAKADELRVAIRNIMARAELKFGVHSSKYKKFGTEALARQTDSDLVITAKRVVRVGTEYLADLAANGLTAAMLTAVTDLNAEFEILIVSLRIKIGDRDIMQEDRVEEGNAAYSRLVKYTTTGLTIWETTDVAKYNDYVIYNTVTAEAPEVPV